MALLGTLGGCSGVRSGNSPSGPGHLPSADQVRLVVSRDFGATVMRDETVRWRPGLDVMTLLAEHAQITTGYGGGFVTGIDGVRSSFGGVSSGQAADWFYWVDGVMADIGAADYKLHGGQSVWWDYHQWSHAMSVPATLAAFPAPWKGHPLRLASDQTWPGLSRWAASEGLSLGQTTSLATPAPAGSLIAATPQQAAATPWLTRLLDEGDGGLRLALVQSGEMRLLSPTGVRGPTAEALAMALPSPSGNNRLFLVVLADSTPAAEHLFPLLTPRNLLAHVAVALVDGRLVSLPWQT